MSDAIRPDVAAVGDAVPARTGMWRHIASGVASGVRGAVDLLLPPLCLACHGHVAAHDSLCGTCWRDVRFIRQPVCDRLGIPLPFDAGERTLSAAAIAAPPDYDRARAVGHFDGTLRTLVHRLKYNDRHEARHLLGRWLKSAGDEMLDDADMLVPVPLARRRLLWRRFNQSALLANELSRLTGLPAAPLVLERIKHTPAQVGLTRAQRRDNVRGAFRVPKRWRSTVTSKRIVLIEDVITTGATVDACARALKRAGAANVDVLALGLVTAEVGARA